MVANAYRDLRQVAMAGEPVAWVGGFEVYLHGRRLAWVKKACAPGALMHPFRLALYPADAGRLSNHHQTRGYFELSARGVRFDGKCLGAARLPDFALTRARLGQHAPGGGVAWEADIRF